MVEGGHSGDRMCLGPIEDKLAQGFRVALKHYQKYFPTAEVKKISAKEINTIVMKGGQVLTREGLIFKSARMKVPELNGRLLLIENMIHLAQDSVIVIKK